MSPEAELAAAGVAVVATVPSAPGGVMTGPLALELAFPGDAVTARLPLVRSTDARAAWLATQLATLGQPGRYYMLIGVGVVPVAVAAPWLCIDAGTDPGWLARVWATCDRSVLLLSAAGDRVLQLTEMPGIPDLLAQAHATADVLAMRADRMRLDRILEAVPGLLRPARPPPRISVRADTLYAAPVTMALPAFSSEQRRETWFVDAIARWRAMPPALDDRSSFGVGPYSLSLAASPYLGTLDAYADKVETVAAIWAAAGHDRFVILDEDRRRALALSCPAETFEARIVVLDQRTPTVTQ